MSIEEEYLKDKGITPSISFKDGKEHKVKIIKRKKDQLLNQDGKMVDGISYLVTEDNIPKKFFTTSTKLVQELMGVIDEEVIIKQKKYQNTEGDWRTTYEVMLAKDYTSNPKEVERSYANPREQAKYEAKQKEKMIEKEAEKVGGKLENAEDELVVLEDAEGEKEEKREVEIGEEEINVDIIPF